MSHRLFDKAKRLLNNEVGTIYKEHGGRITVALAYPNTYYVGMSNLGFQTVYWLFNRRNDVVCERVFYPDDEDVEEFEKTGTHLFTIESQRYIRDYDIIAFSVSFENDYPRIIKMLDLARIPFKKEDRNNNPLMILGGVSAFFNPEPIADFFDIVFVGEGEDLIDEFIESYKRECVKSSTKRDRDDFFKRLVTSIPGIYVPSLYSVSYNDDGTIKAVTAEKDVPQRIPKRITKDINRFDVLNRIITSNTEFGNMMLVEINRGCGRGCRFCMAGFIYRPPRYRSQESITKIVRTLRQAQDNGSETSSSHSVETFGVPDTKVGLVGAAVLDHPEIDDICSQFSALGIKISVSSLRADAITDKIVDVLVASGHKTVSLAPEAGSERLRKVIKKDLRDDDILGAVEIIFSKGIPNLKLYFMIGLPTEQMEDIDAIVSLIKKVHDIQLSAGRVKGSIGRITLSVNCFVPKPFTPFQWCSMNSVEDLKAKLKYLKKSISGIRNVNIIHDLPKWAHFQCMLSRGDRKLSRMLERMVKTGDWRKAASDTGIDPAFYTMRERDRDEVFPWEIIDVGVRREYLWKEYQKSDV